MNVIQTHVLCEKIYLGYIRFYFLRYGTSICTVLQVCRVVMCCAGKVNLMGGGGPSRSGGMSILDTGPLSRITKNWRQAWSPWRGFARRGGSIYRVCVWVESGWFVSLQHWHWAFKKNEESHHHHHHHHHQHHHHHDNDDDDDHHHQKNGFLWVIFGCHKFQCKAWLSQLVPGLRSDEGRQGRRGGLGGVPLCRLGPEWRYIASGKLLHNYGKSPFWIGKSTISMAIFNSYVKLPEGSHYFWNMLGYVGIWRPKHIRNSTSKISKIMNTYEHILVSATSRRRSRHPKNIRLSPGLVAFTVDLLQAVQPGIFFGKRFFVALELKGFWQLFFLGPELQCSWLFLNVFLFFVVTFPSWLEWARISTWLCQSPLMGWCWDLLHDVPLLHDDNWTTVMGM